MVTGSESLAWDDLDSVRFGRRAIVACFHRKNFETARDDRLPHLGSLLIPIVLFDHLYADDLTALAGREVRKPVRFSSIPGDEARDRAISFHRGSGRSSLHKSIAEGVDLFT
jgi:hypothetical protein